MRSGLSLRWRLLKSSSIVRCGPQRDQSIRTRSGTNTVRVVEGDAQFAYRAPERLPSDQDWGARIHRRRSLTRVTVASYVCCTVSRAPLLT